MKSVAEEKPILYSCSGCSSAAQMANHLAVGLNRKGIGEMSCIAGVGGNVKTLVRTALSGRQIIAIDGCPLSCCKACLGNHSVTPDIHFDLSQYGVRKNRHEDYSLDQAEKILEIIQDRILNNYNIESFTSNEKAKS